MAVRNASESLYLARVGPEGEIRIRFTRIAVAFYREINCISSLHPGEIGNDLSLLRDFGENTLTHVYRAHRNFIAYDVSRQCTLRSARGRRGGGGPLEIVKRNCANVYLVTFAVPAEISRRKHDGAMRERSGVTIKSGFSLALFKLLKALSTARKTYLLR